MRKILNKTILILFFVMALVGCVETLEAMASSQGAVYSIITWRSLK